MLKAISVVGFIIATPYILALHLPEGPDRTLAIHFGHFLAVVMPCLSIIQYSRCKKRLTENQYQFFWGPNNRIKLVYWYWWDWGMDGKVLMFRHPMDVAAFLRDWKISTHVVYDKKGWTELSTLIDELEDYPG